MKNVRLSALCVVIAMAMELAACLFTSSEAFHAIFTVAALVAAFAFSLSIFKVKQAGCMHLPNAISVSNNCRETHAA